MPRGYRYELLVGQPGCSREGVDEKGICWTPLGCSGYVVDATERAVDAVCMRHILAGC